MLLFFVTFYSTKMVQCLSSPYYFATLQLLNLTNNFTIPPYRFSLYISVDTIYNVKSLMLLFV
jgi:hypothetical protein